MTFSAKVAVYEQISNVHKSSNNLPTIVFTDLISPGRHEEQLAEVEVKNLSLNFLALTGAV